MALPQLSNSILTEIERSSLFSACSPEELELIVQYSELREYKKDTPVFLDGAPGDALYIVKSGEVLIRKEGGEERDIDLALFLPGDSFGELDLLSGTHRSASAWTKEDSSLIVFPRAGMPLEEILVGHPALSAKVLHRFIVEIAGRIRKSNTLIKENSPLVQELRKQVYTDKLTGLYNKVYLEESLADILPRSSALGLLMVKPDNFKAINDSYGHDAGDQAIKIMAHEVNRFAKKAETVVRYMGNELGLVLNGAGRKEALEEAREIMDFMQRLDFSEATGGNPFVLSVSIGIALFPEHGADAEELIGSAHELPLIGRSRGGNKILFPEDK